MAAFALFLLTQVAVWGQVSNGRIAGKISDPAGVMIHDATIRLRNVATGTQDETQPYVGGLYRFDKVPFGNYEITVEAADHKKTVLRDVRVDSYETVRADAVLARDMPARSTGSVPDGAPQSRKTLFDELPIVEAATLHALTLADVPANVSVITAADIQRFGYRTLGEALSYVRGFYLTNDRIYKYAGVRGLNIPGDYNTRFNVMINGHPMAENIYNSNGFFGQDFGLDMDLVQRIEIVRGPSSALYGSNGILTTINVVTKAPADYDRWRASLESSSFNDNKLFLSGARALGKGVNLMYSGSAFRGGAQTLNIPDFGITRNSGLQRGYHSYLAATVGAWRFTGYFNNRQVQPPLGWGDAIFNTGGNRVRDSRNFVEASYNQTLEDDSRVRFQIYYDSYKYSDRFYFDSKGTTQDSRTEQRGDWIGTRASYTVPTGTRGALTLGAEGRVEIRALQQYLVVSPTWRETAHVAQPDKSVGVFGQQEIAFTRRMTGFLGLRCDKSQNFGSVCSPQLALIRKQTDKTTLKLLYGRPYRNPSSFEQYFGDNQQYIASSGLKQETAQAVEGAVEQKITQGVSAVFNAYRYSLSNVIQARFLEDIGLQQYQNVGAYRSTGVEVELMARTQRVQADASMAFQQSRQVDTNAWLDNSPRYIGKARFATPLYKRVLSFSTGLQYLSSRQTRDGLLTRPVYLNDLTLNTNKLTRTFDLVGGIRNVGDYRYNDPIALLQGEMRQDGRTLFIKLVYHISE